MIRNGNICFVPTRLAAPEICDREFISGLTVSPVAVTMVGSTYQAGCGGFWLHLCLCLNLQQDNSCTLKAGADKLSFLHHLIVKVLKGKKTVKRNLE